MDMFSSPKKVKISKKKNDHVTEKTVVKKHHVTAENIDASSI
jgi:hypothetical protein